MEDLFSKIQEILSSDEGKQQLNDLAQAMGLNSEQPQNNNTNNANGFDFSQLGNMFSQGAQSQNNNTNNANGFDFSQLGNMFSQGTQPQNNNTNNANGFDFSQLGNMFSQGTQSQNNNTNNANGFDFSQLGNMFSQNGENPFGGLDINMLMNIQKMMSAMNKKDDINSNLLLALKPHFSSERQTKIDQAVKMLKLLPMLPMLKDSGLLGGLF